METFAPENTPAPLLALKEQDKTVFAMRQDGREVVLTLYRNGTETELRMSLLTYCKLASGLNTTLQYLIDPDD